MAKTKKEKAIKAKLKADKKAAKKQEALDLPGRGKLLKKMWMVWGGVATLGLALVIMFYFI